MSGSQDCTIKIWDLPDVLPAVGEEPAELITQFTEKAHDKVSHFPSWLLLHSGVPQEPLLGPLEFNPVSHCGVLI